MRSPEAALFRPFAAAPESPAPEGVPTARVIPVSLPCGERRTNVEGSVVFRCSVVPVALVLFVLSAVCFSVLPTTVGEARLRLVCPALVTVFRGYDRFRGRRAQHRDLPLE